MRGSCLARSRNRRTQMHKGARLTVPRIAILSRECNLRPPGDTGAVQEMVMIAGGCLCGAVRYECEGDPDCSLVCYCRDCQRASGSGHVPAMSMPRERVTISGETRSYAATGGSGKTTVRHFCPTCGSLLFSTPEVIPDFVNIYAGTLDDPSVFKPTWSFFRHSHAPWDRVPDDLPELPVST